MDGENSRNILTLTDNSQLTLINTTLKNPLNSAVYSQGNYYTETTKL